MSISDKNLTDILTKCGYKYKDLTKRDITGALSYFKDLVPKLDKYVYPNGLIKELVCLNGTIPVNFRNAIYNIPIQIFLSDSHPYEAPIAYVRPTPDMSINVSDTVDANGRIGLHCLNEWSYQNSDLYMLLNLMTIKFSEQTPLYSKPNKIAQPPSTYPTMGNYPINNVAPYPTDNFRSSFPVMPSYPSPTTATTTTTPYPTNSNPYYPMPTGQMFSHLKSGSNSNIGSTRPTFNQNTRTTAYPDDTIKPEHYRISLISAVEDKIKKRYKDLCDEKIAEIDSLKRLSSDLEISQNNLNIFIKEAENECLNIKHLTDELKSKKSQFEENIKRMKHRDNANIEDVVVTPAPLYRQILQLYTEEQAIQDLIFYLSEGLSHKTINLENFLKQVRLLSRKQFYLRATIQKAREQAALPN
ncbi:unnamed protein product [Brachionus calyciflorus]|uniref:Uncharacterized protein n=1 Tax=Brachionus calyciflorus TaxID=104777 RepID=A0A813LYX1_9BILA|nr:unnamed protein product [Brachionus calyciflorus]